MSLAPLRLLKQHDRRLKAGHQWIFSNEVDTKTTPLNNFEPGQLVSIEDGHGKVLGNGYVNPHSLICARVVSQDVAYHLDQSLIRHRINIALSLRERLFDQPCYRLVYGESDGLPGLVIDRFGDYLAVQITTAGMERMKDAIIAALVKTFNPMGILMRNDSSMREMEGLPSYVESVVGEIPERVALVENGVRFEAPLISGQKTGWFYDHRMNRARMMQYAKGARVLDVFSYIGGWGVQAAAAGATEVTCVDSSVQALEHVKHNAALNDCQDRVNVIAGNAFDVLKQLREERQHFDVVVLDPPAFVKRKKDFKEGALAYQRINQMAIQVLGKDGILVSASCSYHMPREDLLGAMDRAARHIDRNLQILEQGHQGPDHPIHPAIPETAYLKAFIGRVLPR